MKALLISAFSLFILQVTAQEEITPSNFDLDVKHAYTNAMKGVYYALENIPESKRTLNSDIIESDELLAEIKLTKEIQGIKIVSKGVYKTYSVEVVIYRSYEALAAEGFR
ncbi:MAG: hypothetical protein U5K00_08850 [Melioribacteraceae bacterium]|nr:hypothetical protein [Melioribacteraceae bacterium]